MGGKKEEEEGKWVRGRLARNRGIEEKRKIGKIGREENGLEAR